MRIATAISAFGHLALLGVMSVTLSTTTPLADTPSVVAVEVIEIAEITKLAQGARDATSDRPPAPKKIEPPKQQKIEPKKAPKKIVKPVKPATKPVQHAPKKPAVKPQPTAEPAPKKHASLVPPAPLPRDKPATKPAPTEDSDPIPKQDAPKIQAISSAPAPALRPYKAPSPSKPAQTEIKDIAALLNKVPEESANAPLPLLNTQAGFGTEKPAEPVMRLTFSEVDWLRAHIAGCWTPPVGVEGADQLSVQIEFELTQNGMLAAPPRVASAGGGLAFQVAAEAGLRAVHKCQPYRLPVEKFAAWREIRFNFDPREMLGL